MSKSAEIEPIAILADKLVVSKGKDRILKGLSFEIKPGEITGLLGPSGSGKTTLMRAIVGVQKISNGKLEIFNQPAGNSDLRSTIGYVSQTSSIYDDLTVEQNLKYFATILKADETKIIKALRQVDLFDRRRQLVETLSGGQKTRVSLAVALLGDPQLLVLDEPTVGLDPVLRRDLWRLFASMAAKGKTLLVSSHVMDEAEKCDNLLLLRDGGLLWKNSKETLLTTTRTDSVEAAFLYLVERGSKS
ncbi:MAG: ABC transporter ATP-binding protein [Candidatus Saccharibacteria bacterium]